MAPQALLLDIEGMKCGGCVSAVEKRLRAQPGVQEASVNLLSRSAWVELEPPATAESLLDSLAALGFPGHLRDPEGELERLQQAREQQGWWSRWRQLVVALVLLLISSAGHLSSGGVLADMRLHALVATAALAGPGRPILVRGWKGLAQGVPGMDSLVGLGVGTAYLASMVALIWPAVGWSCFFNEPVMLLGFVLLGRFLEARARRRTGAALEELAQLQPETALLLLGDGSTRSIRVGGLRPGDHLRVLPGDRLPVDGVVIDGSSSLDESSLTGEPLPRSVASGDELAAGSLNLQAPLDLKVLRPGSESALARVIALVEQAQARKAPVQAMADRWAGRFTWIVMALALATFLFWWLLGTELFPQVLDGMAHGPGHHRSLGSGAETPFALALQLAIAVLVVACPCALGLATPTAISVATGRAAHLGLLFRGGDVLEVAASVRTVLLDKTGTLTRGRPLLEDQLVIADGLDGSALLQLAASLEQTTRHPLAWALLQAAEGQGLSLLSCSSSSTQAGDGVEGQLDSLQQRCRLGRLAWLEHHGVPVPAAGSSIRSRAGQRCWPWPMARSFWGCWLCAMPCAPMRLRPWPNCVAMAWLWPCLAVIVRALCVSLASSSPYSPISWLGGCGLSTNCSGCIRQLARWRWWVMASMTLQHWQPLIWALRWAREPRSPKTALIWWCLANASWRCPKPWPWPARPKPRFARTSAGHSVTTCWCCPWPLVCCCQALASCSRLLWPLC